MEKIYLYGGALFAFIIFLAAGFFLTRNSRKGKGEGDSTITLKPTKDKDEAAQELLQYLNGDFNRSDKEIAVYDGSDTFDKKGWIFFWDTRKFIETKNPALGLKGSNPVYYNKDTGCIRFVPPTEVFKYFGDGKQDNSE